MYVHRLYGYSDSSQVLLNDGLYLQMEWNDVALNHYLLYKLTDDQNIQYIGRYGC
jgi:hypothetical protein